MQTMLHEYVNDGETRLGFVRSQGLCPHHAWFVQANEQLLFNDGLKTAIIYESVAMRVQGAFQRYLARPISPTDDGSARSTPFVERNGPCRWLVRTGRLGRWLAERLFGEGPAEAFLADLSSSRECPVCKKGREREDIDLRKLLDELADPQFRAWFAASDGLCLPHLQKSLAYAPDESRTRTLVEITNAQFTALLAHLRAYMDKHRWKDRPELRTPQEEASWIRMVAFFAGEARDDQDDSLWSLRQRALCDYFAGLRARDEREQQPKADV